MNKREQKLCTIYQQWLMAGKHSLPAHAWEAKHTEEKSIPFSDVAEHQIKNLLAVTENGMCHKISDQSAGQKPFDGIYFRDSPAYLIMGYKKTFYIISIYNFIHEMKTSKRKSLTEDRAEQISILSVKYK